MNKIIRFKKGKGNTYQVFLDSKTIVLYNDVITKHELIRKKKISDEEVEELEKENKSLDAYYKALRYLDRKVRSEKEIKEYLKKQGFLETSIERTISLLKEKGLLDEMNYIELYIEDHLRLTLDGPEKIKRNLLDLGLPVVKVEEYLESKDSTIWEERIKRILTKKERSKHSESGVVWKQKLAKYLYTYGYPKEMTDPILNQIKIIEDESALEKEMRKWVRKYSSKYQGEELQKRVKQKLYEKGYSKENIEKNIKKIEEI